MATSWAPYQPRASASPTTTPIEWHVSARCSASVETPRPDGQHDVERGDEVRQRVASLGGRAVHAARPAIAWHAGRRPGTGRRSARRGPSARRCGRPVVGETAISSSARAARAAAWCGPSRQWWANDSASASTTGSPWARASSSSSSAGPASPARYACSAASRTRSRRGKRAVRIEPGQRPPLEGVDTGVVEGRAVLVDPDASQPERGGRQRRGVGGLVGLGHLLPELHPSLGQATLLEQQPTSRLRHEDMTPPDDSEIRLTRPSVRRAEVRRSALRRGSNTRIALLYEQRRALGVGSARAAATNGANSSAVTA